jgi:putative transposase
METKQVEKAYVFRLYPTEQQAELISKSIGCARFVYNYFLARRSKYYEETGETLGYTKCSEELTLLKQTKEHLWLNEVDKFALQNSLRNLDTAFVNFFRECQRGNIKQGYPNFKKKHGNRQSYRTNFTNDNIKVDMETCQVKLPKLGWAAFRKNKKQTTFPTEIINATVKRSPSGRLFVSVCCVDQVEILPEIDKCVGVDMGLKQFLILSSGEPIENPRYFRKTERQLAQAQRRLSRMKKGSKNYIKQRLKVAKLHERIANQRKDFLHKQSTRLVKENQIICLEDLQVKNMILNRKLAKSIQDAGWSDFKRMVAYKSDWYGRTLVQIGKFFPSTKKCGHCGEVNPMLTLSEREWQCPVCKTIHDRDQNAAANILNEGLRILAA